MGRLAVGWFCQRLTQVEFVLPYQLDKRPFDMGNPVVQFIGK